MGRSIHFRIVLLIIPKQIRSPCETTLSPTDLHSQLHLFGSDLLR